MRRIGIAEHGTRIGADAFAAVPSAEKVAELKAEAEKQLKIADDFSRAALIGAMRSWRS